MLVNNKYQGRRERLFLGMSNWLGARGGMVSSSPLPFSSLPLRLLFFPPIPSLTFPPLPFPEVGPLNPATVWGTL